MKEQQKSLLISDLKQQIKGNIKNVFWLCLWTIYFVSVSMYDKDYFWFALLISFILPVVIITNIKAILNFIC